MRRVYSRPTVRRPEFWRFHFPLIVERAPEVAVAAAIGEPMRDSPNRASTAAIQSREGGAVPLQRVTPAALIGLLMAFTVALHALVAVKAPRGHPDENYFVEPAVTIAAKGDLNPHWFGHPGSTLIYANALTYHLRASWERAASPLVAHLDVIRDFKDDKQKYYAIGRYISSLFHVLTIPVVYPPWSEAVRSNRGHDWHAL